MTVEIVGFVATVVAIGTRALGNHNCTNWRSACEIGGERQSGSGKGLA